MAQGKRKYSLADFVTRYFENIGRVTLANVIYCIPLTVFLGVAMLIFMLTGEMNILGLSVIIPLMSPFTAGLMYICRKLTAKQEIKPYKDFVGGIKENWKFFSVNGVIVYVVSLGLYVTFAYFRENLDKPIVIFYLVMSLLAGLFFLFMELSMVTMAVSVELKVSELLRNAVMLVTVGILQHLKTLVWLLFIIAVVTSVLLMSNSWVIFFAVLGVITLLFLPVLMCYICIYNSYQTVEKAVIKPYAEEKRIIDAKKELAESEKAITIEELEMLSKGDKDEYVSLKGRMVKRSTIMKMLETKKNMQNDIDDI